MGSYARFSRKACQSALKGSGSQGPWSDDEWPPRLAVVDRLDPVTPGVESKGVGFTPEGVSAKAMDLSQAKPPYSVTWHPGLNARSSAQGFTTEDLLEEVRRAMEWNPEATRLAVSNLLTFVTTPVKVEPAVARGGLAPWQKRKVDRYLKQNLDQPVRIDVLARHVALSVSYFSRAFKQSFGTTPHMHIVRLRLELAQQMMLTSEDSLSQIALACGLADQAHLSKLFRRLLGETPNAWRRRNLTDAQAETRRRSLNMSSGAGAAGAPLAAV